MSYSGALLLGMGWGAAAAAAGSWSSTSALSQKRHSTPTCSLPRHRE